MLQFIQELIGGKGAADDGSLNIKSSILFYGGVL
jgi:hypothetical protein